MAKLATETSDWIRVDTWESETQSKWSPTVTVLRHHQNQIECKRRRLDSNIRSEEEVAQIKLLCGADLLESFSVPDLWKEEDKEEIVSKFGIVCVSRSGSDVAKFIYESDLLTTYSSKIELVNEWISNEISATKIRRALGRGQSVKYLIPDSIIKYIKKYGLYGSNVPVANKPKYSLPINAMKAIRIQGNLETRV